MGCRAGRSSWPGRGRVTPTHTHTEAPPDPAWGAAGVRVAAVPARPPARPGLPGAPGPVFAEAYCRAVRATYRCAPVSIYIYIYRCLDIPLQIPFRAMDTCQCVPIRIGGPSPCLLPSKRMPANISSRGKVQSTHRALRLLGIGMYAYLLGGPSRRAAARSRPMSAVAPGGRSRWNTQGIFYPRPRGYSILDPGDILS